MSATIDYAPQYNAVPHRRPLGPAPAYPSGITGNDQMYTRQGSVGQGRSATNSALPPTQYPTQTQAYHTMTIHDQVQQPPGTAARRTLSNATSSTASSSAALPVARTATNTTYTGGIRRSTSSRSQQPPASSYVALLRRQKATVWCDHAQQEDPRVLAQQRQAKARAAMAVVGGANSATRNSMSSGGGVRSKIRHHGAVKASAFSSAGNMSGAGVPMRLSASEVDDEDSDDDKLKNTPYHHRNHSGRSSLSSGQRVNSLGQLAPAAAAGSSLVGAGRLSEGSTPPSRASYSPSINDPSLAADDTPMPVSTGRPSQDYFARPGAGGPGTSGGSGSSEERSYGGLTNLPQRPKEDQQNRKTSEELRRRGSVDDRTMTMSAGRLFVANPDLSD